MQDTLRGLEELLNHGVRQAIADGSSHAKIADGTGLARSRVDQIAVRPL
jgi:hypothetical protein